MHVIPAAKYDVILGIPWLRKHEPDIRWATNEVFFRNEQQEELISTLLPEEFENLLKGTDDLVLAGILEASAPPVSPEYRVPEEYKDYADLFSKQAAEVLPEHQPWDHTIPLVDGKQPPFGPIYALSRIELETLRNYLDEMLEKGFIQPSSSPAGAPILFAKKKDGSLRLCVDYRGLNDVTVKNRYALPLIHELMDRLEGMKYVTKLDLRGAYNLIRIKKGEEWKTAFRTRYGHFEYRVMPFGLTNAPASFQALLNSVLRQFLDKFVVVYLDDILIFSKTLAEHVQHVRKVLQKLRENKLFVKLEKCVFHAKEVDFLGYIVSREGIRMDPSKVAAVMDWPAPRTLTHLQAFIGFVNFYRRFIPRFSEKCLPLTNLLPQGKKITWTEEAQGAFDALKEAFRDHEHGVLAYFDPARSTIVETDASDAAIAACISQNDD